VLPSLRTIKTVPALFLSSSRRYANSFTFGSRNASRHSLFVWLRTVATASHSLGFASWSNAFDVVK
jgi:hypothetical protein